MRQSEVTRKRLLLPLKALEQGVARAAADGTQPPRISISSIAKTAGVSHTLVHTKYPDVAERIRAASSGSLLEQRERKHSALKDARARIADLRRKIRRHAN